MLIKFLTKLGVAAALLAYIASRVDISAALDLMAAADLSLLVVAMVVSFAIVFADGAFWTASMSIVGCRIAFRPAVVFSLVGWFFANLAPSTVGSDLFRAAQMRLAGVSVEKSVRLVAAARLMSFASLLAVIGAGLPFALSLAMPAAEKVALVAVFGGALAAFIAFALSGPSLVRLLGRFSGGKTRLVAALSDDTRALLLRASPASWFYLTAQHLLRVAGVAAVAAALGVTVDLVTLFALTPAALLVAMIPVSIGGWGVREASLVHFLGFAGVVPSAALAISIVYGLTRIVIGAVGGVVWVIARRDAYEMAIDAAALPDAGSPSG